VPKGGKSARALGPGALKEHNLVAKVVEDLAGNLAMKFVEVGSGDLRKTFGPEDVFGYVYAVLHSSMFRSDFGAQLKTGFPRVPLTPEKSSFVELSRLGSKLVNLHTLQTAPSKVAEFPISDDDFVRKFDFQPSASDPAVGKVAINKTQYFDGVPFAAWVHHVGRYQVCHQWLKERIGRKLSYDEIVAYGRMVGTISDGLAIVTKIDETLALHPLWTHADR